MTAEHHRRPDAATKPGSPEHDFALKVTEALELEGRTFGMEDEFRWYEGWDSLAELALVAMLDSDYGVEIEKADLDELLTVRDLFDEVMRRRRAAGRRSAPPA